MKLRGEFKRHNMISKRNRKYACIGSTDHPETGLFTNSLEQAVVHIYHNKHHTTCVCHQSRVTP